MMYSNKLAVAVKVNDKVLREYGDTVKLPFGAEYSLTFKNMNSVRALLTVEIDGRDATGGVQLIIPPGSSIDLERFIDQRNTAAGHKFKFIELTDKIEQHRGIAVSDGLIKVQFEFEMQYTATPPAVFYPNLYLSAPYIAGPARDAGRSIYNTTYGTAANVFGSAGASSEAPSTMSTNSASNTLPTSDMGITVEGSVSTQEFTRGVLFPTDGVKHTLVFRLSGQTGEALVQSPITVKTKVECPTCGTKNPSAAKFCQECGTGLVII